MGGGYETFEHMADIGIRGRGKTLAEAFVNGAKAMFSLMVEDLAGVKEKETISLACNGYDHGSLFVAWLNALIAEADINNMVFSNFSLAIKGLALKGSARGEVFDPQRHKRGVEVKGATFCELLVEKRGNIWVAQCIVDV